MPSFYLWLAVSKSSGTGGPRHWQLMISEEDSGKATWYQSTGDPIQGKPYKVEINTKSLFSYTTDSRHFLGKIAAKDKDKAKRAVQKTRATFSQRWVVDVLGAWQKDSLVPKGTWEKWLGAMEADHF